jgi:hypothetical protein
MPLTPEKRRALAHILRDYVRDVRKLVTDFLSDVKTISAEEEEKKKEEVRKKIMGS